MSNIKKAGVICEFNPFHNGHKFLLENIKSNYADKTICIMSGSFVQRGDVAVFDKYQRTAAALQNGADVVIELPVPYVLSNAEGFAENGVKIAKETGCDMLCFGIENTDTKSLVELSKIIRSKKTQEKISSYMKDGDYYPRALYNSILELYGNDMAEILNSGNNALALEYIKACEKYDITPIGIERTGATHDCEKAIGDIASGSYIRKLIDDFEDFSEFVPNTFTNPANIYKIESAVVYRLKTMSKEDMANLPDVNEGLENRIYNAVLDYNSLNAILQSIKTKRYTLARIRRIIMCAFLRITKEMANTPLPYIRVLGFREDSSSLLKFSTELPIITTVSSGYKTLEKPAKKIFDTEMLASHLFSMCCEKSSLCKNDFENGIIKQ